MADGSESNLIQISLNDADLGGGMQPRCLLSLGFGRFPDYQPVFENAL